MSSAHEPTAGAGCQLYLISPPAPDPASFAPALDAALEVGGSVAFRLRLAHGERQGMHDFATVLRQICASRAVAFLVQDDVELALAIGADGVHLGPGAGALRDARARLGPERILGGACGTSRDAAMLAGEDGADYIAFGEVDRRPGGRVLELLGWWSELFVLPCLAEGAFDRALCAPAARAGADFIGVRDAVWQHPDGAAAGVRSIRAAIAGA